MRRRGDGEMVVAGKGRMSAAGGRERPERERAARM